VVEQVAIPDELIPADARVEMDAKTAAGYFTPVAPPAPPNWPSPRAGSFTHECSDRPPRSGWHTPVPAGHPAASLLTARAVRSRCGIVMAQVEAGRSPSSPGIRNLPQCAEYVAHTIRLNYPDLNVPYHAAGAISRPAGWIAGARCWPLPAWMATAWKRPGWRWTW
jgi:hypothetical protein